MRQYVGYTIVAVLTIVGWQDSTAPARQERSKAVEHGRMIYLKVTMPLSAADITINTPTGRRGDSA